MQRLRQQPSTPSPRFASGSDRRRFDNAPSVRSNLDRTPVLVGEIKIDASGVLGCPEVDCTLWAIAPGARMGEDEHDGLKYRSVSSVSSSVGPSRGRETRLPTD
jgi:hypothetical protein